MHGNEPGLPTTFRRLLKGRCRHVTGETARAGYPRLDRVSSGEPLRGSRTAQRTSALCAEANVLGHLVLIANMQSPRNRLSMC